MEIGRVGCKRWKCDDGSGCGSHGGDDDDGSLLHAPYGMFVMFSVSE